MTGRAPWQARLPFFYGWVIIAIAFVTMAISVSARTSFSLLVPPLVDEFGWDRGLVAGAFSIGFLVSAVLGPIVGRLMDKYGPRVVIGSGVAVLTAGLVSAPAVEEPWQFYLTIGVLVGSGANLMSFTAQSLYLPGWFRRRRGFAISVAFSGVGVGALLILPWFQSVILAEGWRTACWELGLIVCLVLGPLTLFIRHRPEDIGLLPDGARVPLGKAGKMAPSNIVDPAWANTEWTVSRALRTGRFWWVVLGYFCALFAWYAVQIHQTKYLLEVGFTPIVAAWALGLVSAVAIPGQIVLGALSDRIGREWIWSIACAGFAVSYVALIALDGGPNEVLLVIMVVLQGALGYSMTSVMGPIVAEIFEGPNYGAIFGTVTVALISGGAAGPWIAGLIRDTAGDYRPAFALAITLCCVSAIAIWIAAPRKVRLVPGRVSAPSPDREA